jgi:VRR-NUC domain-containing protein
MITGHEPSIRKLLNPEEQARIDAKQDAALVKRERQEQQIARDWLAIQQDKKKLRFINPLSFKPSTIAEGHPDFTVWLKGGRTLLIEMKADGGKMSPKQQQVAIEFAELDHPVKIVYGHEQLIRYVQYYMAVNVPPTVSPFAKGND